LQQSETDRQAAVSGQSGKTHKGLYRQVSISGVWVMALRVLSQALSFGKYIVLANILGKADMGLLGIAAFVIEVLRSFSDTGFADALIQSKEDRKRYLNAAWTAGAIRGLILFGLTYLLAPLAANLKVPPEKIAVTIAIIRVSGLVLIADGLVNIGVIYFRKELRFDRLFMYEVTGTLVNSIFTIVFAVLLRSVWAMVIGWVAGRTVRMFLSYYIHPYRPRVSFDFAAMRKLWRFGKWVFGASALSFLAVNADDLFVWGYLGVAALGLYQMAYKFSNIPAAEITNVIGQVLFPAYSKIQDDIGRLRQAYMKVFRLMCFIAVGTAGFIFVFTPEFVGLLLKKEWADVVPVMRVLCLYGLIRSISGTRGPWFRATGRPKYSVMIQTVRLALMAILIYPLTKQLGVVGTAWTIVIMGIVGTAIGTYIMVKVYEFRLFELMRPLLVPIAAMAAAGVVVCLMKVQLFAGQITVLSTLVEVIIGLAVYLVSVLALDVFFEQGRLRKIVFEQIRHYAARSR